MLLFFALRKASIIFLESLIYDNIGNLALSDHVVLNYTLLTKSPKSTPLDEGQSHDGDATFLENQATPKRMRCNCTSNSMCSQ